MADLHPAEIVLTGTLLGFSKDFYQDKKTDERRETFVLVFEGDDPRYRRTVKLGKDRVSEVQPLLDPLIGSTISIKVFPGVGNRVLWFDSLVG